MRMDVTLDLDEGRVTRRWSNLSARGTVALKNEVAKDSEPYVPWKSGTLARSVRASIGTPSRYLVYDTRYASKAYRGDRFNFSRAVHPQASARWFEKAKAINKGKWAKVVKTQGGF